MVLAEIEVCLNSKTVCALIDNGEDVVTLTPSPFVFVGPLLSTLGPIFKDVSLFLRNRYQWVINQVQHLAQR